MNGQNCQRQRDKRKPLGPQRSATPLDNFLTPGVLFRFPSDFIDSKMSATFVSALSPSPSGPEIFANINSDLMEPFILDLRIATPELLKLESNESEFNSCNSIRSISPQFGYDDQHAQDFSQSKPFTGKRRKCESCGTRKTPYWREGWDLGIVLCNACGIRFHKYRKVCEICRHIAKKDEKGYLQCPNCLDKL